MNEVIAEEQNKKTEDATSTFLLEEYKMITTTGQQNMQMLLTWFSFFSHLNWSHLDGLLARLIN